MCVQQAWTDFEMDKNRIRARPLLFFSTAKDQWTRRPFFGWLAVDIDDDDDDDYYSNRIAVVPATKKKSRRRKSNGKHWPGTRWMPMVLFASYKSNSNWRACLLTENRTNLFPIRMRARSGPAIHCPYVTIDLNRNNDRVKQTRE